MATHTRCCDHACHIHCCRIQRMTKANGHNTENRSNNSEPAGSPAEVSTQPTETAAAAQRTWTGIARRSGQILYGMGFVVKEHIFLAKKLLTDPPRERFERVIRAEQHARRAGHRGTLRKSRSYEN